MRAVVRRMSVFPGLYLSVSVLIGMFAGPVPCTTARTDTPEISVPEENETVRTEDRTEKTNGTEAADGTVGSASAESRLPTTWRTAWENPPVSCRPLQIIHGGNFTAGTEPEAPVDGIRPTVRAFIERYHTLGLGGVVLNTPFGDQYLRNEEAWNRVRDAVESCRRLGLIVWIYDEDGYPSGGAGTLVYETDPAYESQELIFDRDTTSESPFRVRSSYEFTHATNNFFANRRYANLLDDRACRTFVQLTHEAYLARLGEYFEDGTIEAFFTDEPSMMAIDLGQLPEKIRQQVRKVHPYDETKRQYPAVPWVTDMAEQYESRYGEPLDDEAKRSLFEGDAPRDRMIRQRYWELCAQLLSERYFGRIGAFCRNHNVESSGHCLWEEHPLYHPALSGNLLTLLRQFSLPGLDELSSRPMVAMWGGWSAAGFPGSAAALNGTRRVMSEMSDHSEKMADPPQPASLEWMKASAAWQMALGVTDFTLYYSPADRTADEYRSYCTYVGRINAILRDATPVYETLLYYPIEDIAAEYRPVATKPEYGNQSPAMRNLVVSYMRLGERLTRSQTPFCIVDRTTLTTGRVEQGRWKVGVNGQIAAKYLVIPAGVTLTESVQEMVDSFVSDGGVVLRDETEAPEMVLDQSEEDGVTIAHLARTTSPTPLDPPSHEIVHGRFVRDGRTIHCWVNVGDQEYEGTASVGVDSETSGDRLQLDPETGVVERLTVANGKLPVRLESHRCVIQITD
ncbi:MAG: hypothetical protein Q4C47_04665 [Planctomycetia bacterium]|nr:hypothetical protein [Planctomycetia bacterium]